VVGQLRIAGDKFGWWGRQGQGRRIVQVRLHKKRGLRMVVG